MKMPEKLVNVNCYLNDQIMEYQSYDWYHCEKVNNSSIDELKSIAEYDADCKGYIIDEFNVFTGLTKTTRLC